jgi:hypothetical protein
MLIVQLERIKPHAHAHLLPISIIYYLRCFSKLHVMLRQSPYSGSVGLQQHILHLP